MSENNKYATEKIIKEFVTEFSEYIESIELNILALEKDQGNKDLLNELFRPVHTLKGSASFLGFTPVVEFAHKLENLLDDLRKGKTVVQPGIIEVLLASVDIIKGLINDVSAGGNGSNVNTGPIIEQISGFLHKKDAPPPAAETKEAPAPAPVPPPAAAGAPADPDAGVNDTEIFLSAAHQHVQSITKALAEIEKANYAPRVVDNFFRAVHSLKASSSFKGYGNCCRLMETQEQVLEKLRKNEMEFTPEIVGLCKEFLAKVNELCESIQTTGTDAVETSSLVERIRGLAKDKGKPEEGKKPQAAGEASRPQVNFSENTIRVSMQKLDLLVNLIGELMIDQSRFDLIGRKMQSGEDMASVLKEMKAASSSMARITDDLHSAVMDARMIPVGSLFNRFPRVVRELAKKKNKDIELEISGEETEIDKAIIEEINDPLLHLLRNSADHGVELPDKRIAAGKPAKGTIRLRAYHESSSFFIEVSDDGKGIDTAVVREKAVRNGLVTKEQADQMSEQEAIDLIFLPGFSTAEEVTDISGRGVGMDVVKTNIEKLRGKIHIYTELGKGTKILLKLPMTMAIIETLLVRVGSEIFAVPILAVNAITKVKRETIQTVGGHRTIIFHDKTLGVVPLGELLHVQGADKGDRVCVMVLEAKTNQGGTREMGFIVDGVQDKQKIVVKPLDDTLVSGGGFSGVTILGDGTSALIIDPVELMDMT